VVVCGTAAVSHLAVLVVSVEMHAEWAASPGGLQPAVAAVVAATVRRVGEQACGGADEIRTHGAPQQGAENLV
jgi:hypothetical protein